MSFVVCSVLSILKVIGLVGNYRVFSFVIL